MEEKRHRQLEKNLEDVGWGLLFLAFAALALPRGTTQYAAVAAVGGAMLALNFVRVGLRIPVSWFSVVLGATGLLAGSLALAGTHVDAFVVFCVLAGAVTIAAATVRAIRPVPVG